MRSTLACLMALFAAGPAPAQEMLGDHDAGALLFGQKCTRCHIVKNEAGRVLAGTRSDTGGNFFGLAGRAPASLPEVTYSDHLVAYGGTGAVWEEENFMAFVPDPSGFLHETLGMEPSTDPISLMPTGIIREEQELRDLWAFLSKFSAAPSDGAEEEAPAP